MPGEKAKKATVGGLCHVLRLSQLVIILSSVMSFSAEHAYDLVMLSFNLT